MKRPSQNKVDKLVEKYIDCVLNTEIMTWKKVKYSSKLLNHFFRNYHVVAWQEDFYEYDLQNQISSNWIDIEGLDFGWIWTDYNKEDMLTILRKRCKVTVAQNSNKLCGKNIFIIKWKDYFQIILPTRGINGRSDFSLYFSNNVDVDIFDELI